MKQPLAYIHPDAKIAANVVVEPFSVIDKNVVIDEGTWIGPNVNIFEGARIGKNVKIFPAASISAIPQDLKFSGEDTNVFIGGQVNRSQSFKGYGGQTSGKAVAGFKFSF